MIFSRDYIGYLARRTVKHLIDAKMITTSDMKVTEERVNAALLDELSLEDRINEEVRVILEAYSDEMRKSRRAVCRDVQEGEDRAGQEVQGGAMRISRDKLNKLAHTVADTLAEIDQVGFLEDRNTIRQEARKALEDAAHRGSEDRHGGAAEDRQPAQDHPGRLAGVGHSVPQVLQRRSAQAGDLRRGFAADWRLTCWPRSRIFVKIMKVARIRGPPRTSVALSSRG